MANYLFEQMTDEQAADYSAANDSLFFLTGSPSGLQVEYNAANGLQVESITLNNGTKELTFAANALGGETLTFFSNSADQSTLTFGSNSATGDNVTVSGVAGSTARYYALGGNDTITGSAASDTIDGGNGNDVINGVTGGSTATQSDYLFGGAGADSITGSAANDHIYGNSLTTVQGDADGIDTIDAGAGNDYVNGNAGNDFIFGNDGNDRLYGGAGNDSIIGGDGNDYLQGNKGADTLEGGAGVDELHGGADNDLVLGGADNDLVFGDNGNDTVSGGEGFDKLTGGAGNDTFWFLAGDAGIDNIKTVAGSGVTDQILDYVDGTDKIATTGGFTTVLHGDAGVTVSTVSSAYTYAQSLIDSDLATNAAHHDVAAITVGSDTYLFYNDSGASEINSVIKVVGVVDTVFALNDFTVAA
ncbi:calcium-binding protein [Sphingomonas sp. ASY06-1R]|uniref:calcium-binding protein n=1 Tax=Sphingomonas sp. ASY06-1R TaxID=3445771 RepID=UPI003FA23BE0